MPNYKKFKRPDKCAECGAQLFETMTKCESCGKEVPIIEYDTPSIKDKFKYLPKLLIVLLIVVLLSLMWSRRNIKHGKWNSKFVENGYSIKESNKKLDNYKTDYILDNEKYDSDNLKSYKKLINIQKNAKLSSHGFYKTGYQKSLRSYSTGTDQDLSLHSQIYIALLPLGNTPIIEKEDLDKSLKFDYDVSYNNDVSPFPYLHDRKDSGFRYFVQPNIYYDLIELPNELFNDDTRAYIYSSEIHVQLEGTYQSDISSIDYNTTYIILCTRKNNLYIEIALNAKLSENLFNYTQSILYPEIGSSKYDLSEIWKDQAFIEFKKIHEEMGFNILEL